MDARSAASAACLCLLLIFTGCIPLNGSPNARHTTTDNSPPTKSDEFVPTVNTDDVRPVGNVDPDLEPVQRWIEQIERVDDLHSRVVPQLSDGELIPVIENSYGQNPVLLNADVEDLQTESTEVQPPDENVPTPEPPILGSVTARAAELSIADASTTGETSPAVNAPAEAADQPLTLEEFAEQWLDQPTETSFRGQLDQRLLLILAGKYEQARQPLEMVSDEQKQMATQFVEALIAIREGHGGDPGAEANRVLTQIEALMDSLVPLSDLRIPTLALTRAVRGFGRYEAFDPPHFLTGRENEFVVYCEVRNFLSRPTADGGYESQFSLRTTILNRAGDVVLEINDEHIADKCKTRRHDCFIPRLVRLPATLSPGEYVVKVTIVDKIAKKVAEKRTTFRIVARS